MAVNERSRRMLYDRLEEVLGVGQGDILMEYLPPAGWADVARRRDIDDLAAATKRDIDDLAAATRRDLAEFSQRVESRFAGIDHRFERIDNQFARQTAEITATMRGEIITAITTQNRQTLFAVIGAMLALAGIAGLK